MAGIAATTLAGAAWMALAEIAPAMIAAE